MIDHIEVIQELEDGTPSPQRRRYLVALLASADLKGEPGCGDIDPQRCPAARPAPIEVHGRQQPARCPQTVEAPNRHSEHPASCL